MKHWRWTRRGTISRNFGKSLWLVISLFFGEVHWYSHVHFKSLFTQWEYCGNWWCPQPPGCSCWYLFFSNLKKDAQVSNFTPFYNIIYIYLRGRVINWTWSLCIYTMCIYIYKLKLNHLWGFLYPQRNFPPCPPLPGNPSRLLAPQSVEDVLTIQKMGNPRLITNVGSRIYQKGLRLLVYY